VTRGRPRARLRADGSARKEGDVIARRYVESTSPKR